MLEGAGDLAVRTVREPAPAVGEVLIEVAWCGICGTDRHIYEGQYGGDNLPLTLGHEFSGRIASDSHGPARRGHRGRGGHQRAVRALSLLPRG